jgi:thiamine monophosphate synthase
MFIIKNNYYLYIENTKDININDIKKNKKISIVYRNNKNPEIIKNLVIFKKKCALKGFKLYIANNYSLAIACKADGLYYSSYNKNRFPNDKLEIIGSAHNFSEIYQKLKQGCKTIILSRLFETSYQNKRSYYGIIKFNLITKNYQVKIVPLGGINKFNLLKLNMVNSKSLALLSEVKKKPVITNRLF